MVIHHDCLRDKVFDLCRHAYLLSVSVERGRGLTRGLAHTWLADILIAGWDRGKPAALDLTITSPLCCAILSKSCHQAGVASYLACAAIISVDYQCFQSPCILSLITVDKDVTSMRSRLAAILSKMACVLTRVHVSL